MSHHHKGRPDKTAARQKIAQRTDVRCLCPQRKVWAPSKSQAKKIFRAIERRTHTTDKVYFYQCAEGGWHWTRLPPDQWPTPQESE